MEVVHEWCCGLDIHKRSVTACVITPGSGGIPRKQFRTFGTMTDDLLALRAWLSQTGATHVAMESTGVYWKPVWNLLEDGFELTLANAQQTKPMKGQKTDIKDCEHIADFLRHGLIKPSFVPNRELREQRELTRYRTTLVKQRAAELNRLQKTLEGGNVKLASVVSDINGKSARQMLEALAGGQTDVTEMANLARGRLRTKLPELQRALAGRFAPHQRFMLAQQLALIDQLDAAIAAIEAEIKERMRPVAAAVECIDTIPGIAETGAYAVLAETGVDMSKFLSAKHMASWGKICPGNNESAGKRRNGRTGKGNRWLKSLLVEFGHAAGKTKGYLGSQYHRIAARRGKKKAAIAVGHSILIIIFHLLSNPGLTYQDLGPHYFDERDMERLKNRLVHRLEGLGFKVNLEAA